MMKRFSILVLALLVALSTLVLSGCGRQSSDPGAPPAEVLRPEGAESESAGNAASYDGTLLENAISVKIGLVDDTDWSINMYNIPASNTILGYLSAYEMRFPTYTYDEDAGFVAQRIRGTYGQENEETYADVHTGELYLFSDGQLRLYFKDVEGADITATLVGYFAQSDGLTEAVEEAYTSNLNDSWGVDVYFLITKTLT